MQFEVFTLLPEVFPSYLETSILKRARERLDECRRLVADGVNPCHKRMAERQAGAETFEAVAREWFAKQESNWAKSHSSKVLDRMQGDHATLSLTGPTSVALSY